MNERQGRRTLTDWRALLLLCGIFAFAVFIDCLLY
jgi:hypothetical protein